MKIVFVNPSLKFGGSERVIALLANHFFSLGHVVTIVTTDREEESFFYLEPGIKRIGILKSLPKSPFLSLYRKMMALKFLRKTILGEKPDIVYSFQEVNSIYTMISLIGVNLYTVIAVRNHPAYKKLSFFQSLLRKLFYKKANEIVVQTKAIEEWFKEHLDIQSTVIANPVNKENKKRDNSEVKVIYACGRLVPQKGFSDLIRIFHELHNHKDWKLKILGDGKQKEFLSKQISDLDLEGTVILEGAVDAPLEYYKEGGVFAFTSEFEGFPNSLCEAMASGMAVVSYDCPSGPSDLIVDGKNGFLVPQGDEGTFKEKLKLLISDEALRMKLGKEAKKIRETLAIEKIAQQWLDLKG